MAAFAMLGLLAVPLAGCDLPACESLDLRKVEDRASYASQYRALLAVGGHDQNKVTVVRECDSIEECEKSGMPIDKAIDQLMLTASGRWLIYLAGRDVSTLDVEACNNAGLCEWTSGFDIGDGGELVGTLRGGDWIIYRKGDGSLWARFVGDDERFEGDSGDISVDDSAGLVVGALGYRHIVARRARGDGTEELYLIRVAPALKVDVLGSTMIGEPQLLATGPGFRRILITEGPSPADRGDPKEFQHQVPTDAQVIATAGEGPEARTLIYDVSNLNQIANFAAEVVTKHAPLEDIPGLSAVSPDGSHLAYITNDGGLALRNLSTQRSCLVRSSDAATHLLAGFAADATLYFEAEEEAYARSDNTGYALQKLENIYAYDPLTETVTALTSPETDPRAKVWRLRAVPPERGDGPPWAVAGYNGDYIVKPGSKAKSLDYVEAQFLPRSEQLWVLEAADESRLVVRQLGPNVDPNDDDAPALSFSHESKSTVCVSSSPTSGWTTPWATRCSSADDPEGFLDNGVPPQEHPYPIPDDPEGP
jgi:hypothetical protein